MNLPTRGLTEIVRDMSAGITASAGRLIDVSVGSVLRAIIDANAAMVLWIQWLVLLTLQTTRAATSTGLDLDSWVADFSLTRLPAAASSGTVTFARYSGAAAASVPIGTVVKTQDGSVSFGVTADVTNPAWQTTQNAFSLTPGVMSIDLPVTALISGIAGNVLPNTITLLASPILGIDFLNNTYATTGGTDPESDGALRARFANFFAARSRATLDAIGYAISLVGPDLQYTILENVDAQGDVRSGNMLIIVDDGSGQLSPELLTSLSLAIDAVRPVGTTFSIQPPQVIQVEVGLSVTYPPQLLQSIVQNEIESALTEYINQRPIGGFLSLTRISQIAYQTEPRILNIANVTLNNQHADLVAPPTASFIFQQINFS
jgi:uncharacterized phage protein gp47/JayE